MEPPLIRLAGLIDWGETEPTLALFSGSGRRRPDLPVRLATELLYLQNTLNDSDEAEVNTWAENPDGQFFCDETYLHAHRPIEPHVLEKACWKRRRGDTPGDQHRCSSAWWCHPHGQRAAGDCGHYRHAYQRYRPFSRQPTVRQKSIALVRGRGTRPAVAPEL